MHLYGAHEHVFRVSVSIQNVTVLSNNLSDCQGCVPFRLKKVPTADSSIN